MIVLQLFNREKNAFKRFSEVNALHMDAFKDAIMAHAVYYPVVEFLSAVAIACVIWFGGNGVLGEDHHPGRPDCIHPILAAVLPSHSGLERKVQHSAIGYGRGGAGVQAAGHSGRDHFPGEYPQVPEGPGAD